MGGNLVRELSNYYRRRGNKVIFPNGKNLTKVGWEMRDRIGGADPAFISKVIHGDRDLNPLQLETLCDIIELIETSRRRLRHALFQDYYEKHHAYLPIENLPIENLPVESLPVESLPVERLPVERLPILPQLYPQVAISGPPGVGKKSVIHRMKELGPPFHFAVSATTRQAREGEVHGKDHFFLSMEEFAEMILSGELLEYKYDYVNNCYEGTSKRQVQDALASGKDVIMSVDMQGAETIRRLEPRTTLIFLCPGSENELVARLQLRIIKSPKQRKLLISMACNAMGRIDEFDYCVVNREGQLDEAARDILDIMTAEKLRTINFPPFDGVWEW